MGLSKSHLFERNRAAGGQPLSASSIRSEGQERQPRPAALRVSLVLSLLCPCFFPAYLLSESLACVRQFQTRGSQRHLCPPREYLVVARDLFWLSQLGWGGRDGKGMLLTLYIVGNSSHSTESSGPEICNPEAEKLCCKPLVLP